MASGLVLQPQAVSPFSAGMSGIYTDASKNLIMVRDGLPTQNVSAAVSAAGAASTSQMTNNTGLSFAIGDAVSVDGSGYMAKVDPSSESSSLGAVGVAGAVIADGTSGSIITSGELQGLITSLPYGTPIYVNALGVLTGTKPDLSTPGFSTGYFVIKIGTIKRNPTTGLKDLVINVQVVAQL